MLGRRENNKLKECSHPIYITYVSNKKITDKLKELLAQQWVEFHKIF